MGNRSTDLGGETGFLLRCHLLYPLGDPIEAILLTNLHQNQHTYLLMRLALIKLDRLYF